MQRQTSKETLVTQEHEQPERAGAAGCLLRAYWMIFGNALVALSAGVMMQGPSLFTGADLLFGFGVISLLGVRYWDIRSGRGSTAYGEPATMEHWRRYALRVLGVSVALWLVAHAVGYFGGL